MVACPLRQPCQATHTLPLLSVAAAGSMSTPASVDKRTALPACPFSIGRAQISKLPFSFCDQKTQGRPEPSTAIVGRWISPPAALISIGAPQEPLLNARASTRSPPVAVLYSSKSGGAAC